MNYFDKIPTISYGGRIAKNLMAKAQFSAETKSNKFLYYPYTIIDAARSDVLSDRYYDGPGYSWLIWMTNNIIDPYYEMPLNEEQFNSLIASKYGSLQQAQRKIKCWRNNWFIDTDPITIQSFNSLPRQHKVYYDPVIDNYLNVVQYKRKVDDTTISTNVIAEVVCGASFTVGEEVSTPTGYGCVEQSDSQSTVLTNVVGSIAVGQTLVGKTSTASSIVTSYTVNSTTTAAIDSAFWAPVSVYQYEYDLNEGRKHIKMLDNRYKNQVVSELQRVMQQ